MAAKKRKVRIMKAVRVLDETGEVAEDLPADFWPHVVDSLEVRKPEPYYDWPYNGHEYRGRIKATQERIVYLAKQRNADDAPSEWDGDEGVPLKTPIHEPLFMLPIAGTPAIAVLGTSGAASATAVGRWLTGYMSGPEEGESIQLHPVIRQDQAERLEKAVTATSLELSVEAADFATSATTGQIETALAQAAATNEGRGRAYIKLSLGSGRHLDGNPEFLETARRIRGNPALRVGRVTALVPHGERGLRSEVLDLISQRFVYEKAIGDSETSLSVDTAFPALSSTVEDFRKSKEYKALADRTKVD